MLVAFSAITLCIAYGVYRLLQRRRQRQFIASYDFPPRIKRKLLQTYDHLSDDDVELVFKALKDYFTICQQAGKRMLAMPSQVVDIAWHEFILFTVHYQRFCRKGLGRFLHHTPTEAMESPVHAQDGIKRSWRLACLLEGIDPKEPKKIPLLFALDKQLAIPDGFNFVLDCKRKPGRDDYCAAHVGSCGGCASSCGGSGDSSCSSCGGGCGGD